MRKIDLGGQDYPATFTTWAADEFHRLTGLNLYEPGELRKVFKGGEDEKIVPSDLQTVAKFAYCAMAAGCMPKDAGPDWKPDFTWQWVMNQFSFLDSKIYPQLVAVYYDEDLQAVIDRAAKNSEALQVAGQEQ